MRGQELSSIMPVLQLPRVGRNMDGFSCQLEWDCSSGYDIIQFLYLHPETNQLLLISDILVIDSRVDFQLTGICLCRLLCWILSPFRQLGLEWLMWWTVRFVRCHVLCHQVSSIKFIILIWFCIQSGSRLFGFIGAGATLGQLFGSLFATLMAWLGPRMYLPASHSKILSCFSFSLQLWIVDCLNFSVASLCCPFSGTCCAIVERDQPRFI